MQNIELLDSQVYFSSEHSSWSYSILNEKNQEFCGQAVTNRLVSNFFLLSNNTIEWHYCYAHAEVSNPFHLLYYLCLSCDI